MDLQGKVVIVTGAGGGIGGAVADRLAGDGALTVCSDLDADAVQITVDRVRAAGGQVVGHASDASDPAAVQGLVEAAAEQGGPHAVVSNAAIQYEQDIVNTPPEAWDRVMAVNARGPYLLARAAIPRMRELGGGSIVLMASVNGFWVEPELGAYSAAKGAVITLSRTIATDFGQHGIRSGAVCPGYIDTGMAQQYFDSQADPVTARKRAGVYALGRIGRPEEVAAVVSFLCSDDASFCTGHEFVVDGGLSTGASPTEVAAWQAVSWTRVSIGDDRVPLPPAIAQAGVLAIVRGAYDNATLVAVGTALVDAGVSAVEMAANSLDAEQGIAALRAVPGLTVGVGTVLSRADGRRLVSAGATFVVMPHVDPDLVGWAAEQGLPNLPGAYTATEALSAWRAGASAVKLFPAALSPDPSLGPAYLAALRGPLHEIPFVPTGGISADNAEAFIAAGAVALAAGSWLVPERASDLSLETLDRRARTLVRTIADARGART